MMIDITPVVQAIIALLCAVAVIWVKPRLERLIQQYARDKDMNFLRQAIRTAVIGAEQLIGAGKGAQKLAQVLAWLKDGGFNVDIGTVRAEIEAAVKEILPLYENGAYELEIEYDDTPKQAYELETSEPPAVSE
ncbi:MAG: phage holin family protein [Oscillospiraceae bacterium]|jgi:type II secretory pathway pseudopilin PulG|nr:phage holin family protein [Oscillospiraceae bacterium]